MAIDICGFDMPLLQKKAQRDALGIEILVNEITRPFVMNYQGVKLLFAALRLKKHLKGYLKNYDIGVCAKCHGFDECSKAFYETDKSLLAELSKNLPALESIIQRVKFWPFDKSNELIKNCQEQLAERIENMELIMETSDGVLDEIANALEEAKPKLKNWREAMPFLQ